MAPHFDQILGDPDSTFYLGSAASVHMLVGEDYADYIRHFREGTRRSYQAHNAAFMAEVAQALVALPRIFLDYVLPTLPALEPRLSSAGRLLDLGCGSGWAVVQIAERFPGLHATGVDVEPYSVEAAKCLIAERGLSGRCEALLGSSELAEPGAYDLVTSFLVIHEIDPAQKAAVFADISRSLKPGGAFLIFDEAYPESDEDLRQMPKRFAALAQWYEVTWGNRVSTRTELVELCTAAGLDVMDETAFSRFHIILATKPA
jgi:SAM-dependent methyltransferase